MAKHTVFESTNMASAHYAERIFDAIAESDVDNGTFGYLDGLADGESNIYKFVHGVKAGEDIVVVDQPAWKEDESRITNQRRDKFFVEDGIPFRVRSVKKRDEFAETIEGFTDDTKTVVTEVDDFSETPIYVTIDASGKLVASKTKTANADFEATIMRKRKVGAVISTPLRNYGYANDIYEMKITTLA